jgi:hypothetical protein
MRVQVFLKTPLARGHYGADRDAELKATVVELAGEAIARDGGLEVSVSTMYDNKGNPCAAPFRQMFLPAGKIDYYVIVEQ